VGAGALAQKRHYHCQPQPTHADGKSADEPCYTVFTECTYGCDTNLRTAADARCSIPASAARPRTGENWVRDTRLGDDAHCYREENGVQILAMLGSLPISPLELDLIWPITKDIVSLVVNINGPLQLLGWRGQPAVTLMG